MAVPAVGIEIAAKLTQFKKDLAQLGPEAGKAGKQIAAQLARQLKVQQAEMKRTAEEARRSAEATKALSDVTADAAVNSTQALKALGPLGGVLAKMSPEAGAAASSVAALTSAFEGFAGAGLGATFGGMLAVIAPVGLAVAALTLNMQYEAQQAEASKAAHDALNDALRYTGELAAGTADAMLDLKVRVGQMTPEDAAFEKAIKSLSAEFTTQKHAIEEQIEARKKLGGSWGAEVAALRQQQDELDKQAKARALVLAADREYAEEVRKSNEFIAERDRAVAEAAKSERQAAEDREEEIARIAAAQDLAYAQMMEHELAARDARWQTAREAVETRQMELDAADAAAEASIALAKKTAAEEIVARESVKSASVSIMGSATDALMLLSDSLAKENRSAALAAFNAAKAVGIATAIVNTAIGITNALATGGAAAPFLAVAAGVAGGVAIAQIAATEPSFAGGGFIDGAPTTGISILAHPEEAVLNQRGRQTIGDDTIRDANNGVPSSSPTTVSMVYKHKVFDYFMGDHLGMDNATTRAMRRGDRVGLRRRGRG